MMRLRGRGSIGESGGSSGPNEGGVAAHIRTNRMVSHGGLHPSRSIKLYNVACTSSDGASAVTLSRRSGQPASQAVVHLHFDRMRRHP